MKTCILTIADRYRTALTRHSVKVGCAPSKFTKDEDSAHWLPTDTPHVTPMQIYGDGNCLPRCASVMVYGHQECHDEMRIRIVLEIAADIDEYLDSTNLKEGSKLDTDLPKVYAMYSEHYTGQKLSHQAVRSILEVEVQQCAKPAFYIWEFGNCTLSVTSSTASWCLSILNMEVPQSEDTSIDGSLLSQSRHLLFNGHRWQSCGPPHMAGSRKPKIGEWTTSLYVCQTWHNRSVDLYLLIQKHSAGSCVCVCVCVSVRVRVCVCVCVCVFFTLLDDIFCS